MNKRNYITANELFAVVWIIILAIFFVITFTSTNWSLWRASHRFNEMAGYIKEGTILAHDSTLRVPDDIVAAKQIETYCMQFNNLLDPSEIKIRHYTADEKYNGYYCGCLPLANHFNLIRYKLYPDKIVYHCKHELYYTTLIPALLKGK